MFKAHRHLGLRVIKKKKKTCCMRFAYLVRGPLRVRARKGSRVCIGKREQEREREGEGERECVYVCTCVCEREREKERARESVCVRERRFEDYREPIATISLHRVRRSWLPASAFRV